MSNATIRFNKDKNGIEISFSKKPDEKILQSLKNDRFRWSKYKGVWYTFDSPENRVKAEKYGTLPTDNCSNNQGDQFDNEILDNIARQIGA
jgi:hypothetical protein